MESVKDFLAQLPKKLPKMHRGSSKKGSSFQDPDFPECDRINLLEGYRNQGGWYQGAQEFLRKDGCPSRNG
jgi:hypothetical protein